MEESHNTQESQSEMEMNHATEASIDRKNNADNSSQNSQTQNAKQVKNSLKKKLNQKPEKNAKVSQLEARVDELTQDLQRTRADFENFRKRAEIEKTNARHSGQAASVVNLLPVIDNIERAIMYIPEDLQAHPWAQGVTKLIANLEKSLASLGVRRIAATPGTLFDPEVHEAIQFDEDPEGDQEVVIEELQAGYSMKEKVIRHAMVKVGRQAAKTQS